ncbi:hypothetical protein [Mucilaginibacter terrae]|uniref:Uncharacterized protein n=1 Tax=Mucilaginibacter terrae TaxID=1955052 RepID=A0ABU3GS74_9SPHI|nr:hypothetical protein [Mucilaginibacter terrae]MDT3402634.1 hypothetical protein [Mucilaginibacter terrae]
MSKRCNRVVVIKKDAKKKEIAEAVKKLQNSAEKKPVLSDFFGKLKGAFGDPIEYQQKIRNEWD